MDTIPERNKLAQLYRQPLQKLESRMPIFIKNPCVYQLAGLLLSVLFLFAQTNLQQIILISVILMLDWLDGAAARRYDLTSKQGYITDLAVDRISEGLIFIAVVSSTIGKIFFG